MKKSYKIIFGSFSALILIFMITSSLLMHSIFLKQKTDVNSLNIEIKDLQNKINTLTENLIQTKLSIEETKSSLEKTTESLGSIDKEIYLLKASVGEDFSGIIENSVKSVITLRTDVSQGTGFIISPDGYIVTNAHILFGGRKIFATTYKQDTFEVEFIGYDEILDIALLKIPGNHEKLNLGDSNKIQIGEKVITIGNPLGLQFSVSQGIVSGTHRPGINKIEAYVQTDAALNPGNSGGPLINKKGKVIGINNFKIGGGENLGFALESNYLKEAVNEISIQELNQTLI